MVDVKFEPNANSIVVDVELIGAKIQNLKMILDTGATFIMIPWRIIDTLGMQITPSQEYVYVTTASGVEKVPLVVLETVSVLGKTASKVQAIVHDLPQKSYVDGLLGLSFLRNFNIHINFKEGLLSID